MLPFFVVAIFFAVAQIPLVIFLVAVLRGVRAKNRPLKVASFGWLLLYVIDLGVFFLWVG